LFLRYKPVISGPIKVMRNNNVFSKIKHVE
jgi:hypothetical protein